MKRLQPFLATDLGLLYATDCFNLFASLRDESVDCVFADPPFNLRKDYGRGAVRDDLARLDYLKWSFQWLDESVRVIAPGGALFVYILPSGATTWPLTSKSGACSSATGSRSP